MADWITSVMTSLGYWGIAALMFLENVFPPIPSELIMPLAGFSAGRGEVTLWGVILAGTVGSVLGQLPLYYLGRAVGGERLERWADRWGRWVMVSSQDIRNAQSWLDHHQGKAVLLCRLVPGVRSLISIPAGVAKMNLGLFLLYSALGMGVWAAALAVAGMALGSQYDQVTRLMGPASWVVWGMIAVAVVCFILWRKWGGGAGQSESGPPR